MNREDAEVKIHDAMMAHGSYTHNVISLVLQSLAETEGKEVANEVIIAMGLEELYGISQAKV